MLLEIFMSCLTILLLSYALMPSMTYIRSSTFTIPFTIGLFVPFAYILTYIVYHILSRVCHKARNQTGIMSWFYYRARRPENVLPRISYWHRNQTSVWSALVGNHNNSSLDDSLPHRLLFPGDYSDSVQEREPLLGAVNNSTS